MDLKCCHQGRGLQSRIALMLLQIGHTTLKTIPCCIEWNIGELSLNGDQSVPSGVYHTPVKSLPCSEKPASLLDSALIPPSTAPPRLANCSSGTRPSLILVPLPVPACQLAATGGEIFNRLGPGSTDNS